MRKYSVLAVETDEFAWHILGLADKLRALLTG